MTLLHTVFGLTNLSSIEGVLFYLWVSAYSVIILFFAIYPRLPKSKFLSLSIVNTFDIIMMAIFMYINGNVQNGFGILILPFVATASLLNFGRYYLVYGALASIAVFVCVILQVFYNVDLDIEQNKLYIFQAGLLSTACLFVSFVTSILSRALKRAAQVAVIHEDEIANLNRLNELALQGLTDAVIVFDEEGDIQQFNAQAKNYFPFLKRGEYFPIFQSSLNKWNEEKQNTTFIIDAVIGDIKIVGRAISVEESGHPLLLMFLRSTNDLAKESHRIKLESLGRLTANIAHEVRNPLSAIRQSSELLGENLDKASDQRFVKIISKNVERIDHLVEEVLTLNKKDRLNPVNINLKEFIHDFLLEFQLAYPETKGKIDLRFDQNVEYILFDLGHLQQILGNLLNNAWRHANQEKPIVAISVIELVDQKVAISVFDNGEGIKEEVLDKIFEPFFTTEKTGTGLGLYIGRELALTNGAFLDYIPSKKCFELICKAIKDE
ncbi:two-component system sensor histidine kinase NtrB [Neisseria sp. Ec49-e6-T10]|uniref:two-component system sensor histidine kinase NtrB n=1 Tax=Neisseria sp. Ec49-e6-T10 TaxID=3140744 RepID=UPI003EBD8A3F